MCGITGAIWSDGGKAISQADLLRMTDSLEHRGPDDQGQFYSEFQTRPPYEPQPGVALGFRRLSIIDLSTGHQPMTNEDGSVVMIFNGEIYNFQDLRRRLEGAGHTFRTESDSETIVHLYEDEGERCFELLNGMFAIAIWDSRQRRLLLARDRLGQKPLAYHHQAGRLVFASELKSLLQLPDVSRELDPSAIDEYFTYQYIPHPNSVFKDIRKLPPAHYAEFKEGQLRIESYWNPDFTFERPIQFRRACQRMHELLEDATALRMQSDVPLGAFLSGGVDSSLIVALMQKYSEQPVKTFSIGFPVAEYDESSYAKQVADYLGTEHHEFKVEPNAVEILPKLVYHYDEPFSDSSAIPTWYVSQMTREHVTVALTGDGGDELFAGYPRYRAVSLADQLEGFGLRGLLGAKCWQWLPSSPRQKSIVRRFKRFSEALRLPEGRRYLDWISIYNESRRASLYNDDFLESLPNSDPYSFLDQALKRSKSRDSLTRFSLADLVTYLPCDLMTKVDIASMAHSLECRSPFLDHRVVEFAASLPMEYKFRAGKGKRILRRAFKKMIPNHIWLRRKMGFGVPLDHWFRNELKDLARDTLLADDRCLEPYVRREAVESMLDDHIDGRFDHSYRLWSLLVFELWMREWGRKGCT